jgi:hypothetical protein
VNTIATEPKSPLVVKCSVVARVESGTLPTSIIGTDALVEVAIALGARTAIFERRCHFVYASATSAHAIPRTL